jgi:hypothetical protein
LIFDCRIYRYYDQGICVLRKVDPSSLPQPWDRLDLSKP